MRRSLRRTFFRPERPTLTSRSLQSITRPFQKRFREVFGNARILIFYLSIKAWEEKSLPKSHLGWFFLVFGEGKATKKNMSISWFIWPLNCLLYADDLLLISTSAEGLQQSLDRLSKYCQDWLLKINPTKTKVIVFQKKSRKSAIDKHNYIVSNENVNNEIVNNYTSYWSEIFCILQITRRT